ncbi:MAG: hypothetical protein D9C04_02575 [Nitrosopumilus sp. B06]|nr:MAG: hypothetical protein D9C04_02575 [Nitrosopumilus sp. B06]
MVKTIQVDITPDKSLIKKLGAVGYSGEEAIAELIDNAIDARIENTAEQISVLLDFGARRIEVRDNGHGMDKNDLINALTVAKGTKQYGSLGEFGIGLKSACSALGKSFVIRTSKKGTDKEYLVKYDEDEWMTDNSLDWNKFNMTEKTLGQEQDWHGTAIVIDKLKISLYTNQSIKFRKNFGMRYASYIQEKDISIQINTMQCEPIHPEIEPGSKTHIILRLSNGRTIRGYAALMKKRSMRGNYGINLFRHGRLIKPFEKFGILAHPEYARITGVLNLNHVPVNFYKNAFIEESEEYQEISEAFKVHDSVRSICYESRSKREILESIEPIFDYVLEGKQLLQSMPRTIRSRQASDMLNSMKPFQAQIAKATIIVDTKPLKTGPLYSFDGKKSEKMLAINTNNIAFNFVKNPFFLVGMIAIEAKLMSENPDIKEFIQHRNKLLNEFLEYCFRTSKKKITRDEQNDDLRNHFGYRLADELIEIHDFLKENSIAKFQFTAMSTLKPHLHNLREKVVYAIYTTPNKGEYLADLLRDKFKKNIFVVKPTAELINTLSAMPNFDQIIVIREYSVIRGRTVAGPEKAFVDLVVESHTYDMQVDEKDVRRIFQSMERDGLIDPEKVRKYGKIVKKLPLIEDIIREVE